MNQSNEQRMTTEPIQISSLDHHFAEFINRIDCNPCDELWLAAALASNASGCGHTCLEMAAVAGKSVAPFCNTSGYLQPPETLLWRSCLELCDTVGSPGAYTPLVLDGAGRLYLQRSWEYERVVAAGILSRSRQQTVSRHVPKSGLDQYFPIVPGSLDLQREAALMALTHRFSVISGGPGTGKTATVARILALLLESPDGEHPKIALAAPTGKAAMRLRQSIMQAAGRLDLREEVRNRLPNDVSTIHRLLGFKGMGEGFHHNRDNRLTCDILVIDEASMIDLPLMAHLLEALRDDAALILLGDRDQLASVEAGAVLADICADSINSHNEFPPPLSPLMKGGEQNALSLRERDREKAVGEGRSGDGVAVTQLTRSYRFGEHSGIGSLSRLINAGDWAAALDMLASGSHADLVWHPLPAGRFFEDDFGTAVRKGYDDYVRSATPEDALAGLDNFRVLTPLRSGTYGVENLNRLCQEALDLVRMSDEPYYPLMPILVAGNNYELGLFNGDTGVVMDYDGRPAVWFSAQEGGVRHLSPLRLPPHETAFALTVHKSQGSEFDNLLLILPDRMSEVLGRELLYTAVTRARHRVEIWGTEDVFRQAVERRTRRSSGLRDRLAGVLP